ncbi:MAG: KH domain-containing protein [Proteobacteria bacterium]|nr:KH domain-containing protein [Pseudomonadota bacterium]
MKKRTIPQNQNDDKNRVVVLENQNIDRAIEETLRELKIKRARADIKITEYITHHLLFFKKKNQRIEVSTKGEKKFLLEALGKILDTLNIEYESAVYTRKKGLIILTVNSKGSGNKLIGKQGKTVQAIEYLLNKIALNNNIKVKIIISVNP